ncbi:MAG: hypothetical protein WKF75_13335 [Singulisphaera sp.]
MPTEPIAMPGRPRGALTRAAGRAILPAIGPSPIQHQSDAMPPDETPEPRVDRRRRSRGRAAHHAPRGLGLAKRLRVPLLIAGAGVMSARFARAAWVEAATPPRQLNHSGSTVGSWDCIARTSSVRLFGSWHRQA